MHKGILTVFSAVSLLLVGCSTSPSKDAIHFAKKQADTDIYGELRYENGSYVLSPFFYHAKYYEGSSFKTEKDVWKFKIPSLEPAFNTSRFKCKKTVGINGCESWEKRETHFQHVNFTKSAYGNTPEQNRKILQEEAQKEPITTKDVVTGAVAAPFGAAALAVVGYSALFVGAVTAPIMVAEAVVDPDQGFERNNWVEFEHQKFHEVVNSLVVNEFESVDNYARKAKGVSGTYANLYNSINQKNTSVEQKGKERIKEISIYNSMSEFVPKFKFSPAKASGKIAISENFERFEEEEIDRIESHYRKVLKDQNAFYNKAKSDAVAKYSKKQKSDFNLSVTSYQIGKFIEKYESLDQLSLIPKAKVKLKKALADEEKRRVIAAEKERLKRQKEQEQLARWRASVKSGDDTFCGPIIEVNQSMIKIAVRAQLQGYGNEAWLKRSELYPSSKGCLNQNGRLYPKG
ncbi:hypothetical protein [Endozoicomonas euniceicola]|uniref:Lipoprotein n=1 Tax=Endozoicomonas euniceicola TaxID=1234143 RepID=A0ABY6GU05_9GAMM|nr:hypothetical protein [Endozoicomonas euniceicola]UYM16267.1 hypothetical protein NX720_26310 [Endozoicomonas euniceicola]